MKTIATILILLSTITSNAQFLKTLGEKAKKAAERTVERKTEQKSEQTTDKTIDKVFEKKNKSKKESSSTSGNTKKTRSVTSAKDFVAGTKVIASDDFSQDAIGDFPVNWFTNSSGEVVIFSDSKQRWLKLNDSGTYSPTNFNRIPDNCTFEFDLTTTENFSFYSTVLKIGFVSSKKKNDYVNKSVRDGILIGLHPQTAGNRMIGISGYDVFSGGANIMTNQVELSSFNNSQSTAKVQIWRQKNRLRMYVNGDKVWDLPNAFQDATYNRIVFYLDSYTNKEDKYYISNLRLAEAGADTRHKLIETGSFSTNEILFDTNKSSIKSSSASVLEDLGKALSENPSVKVGITGHTDSDGKEADNQKLSQQRAESVKNYLASKFNIDKNRMTTFGKGENEPIVNNTSEENKKQNRRVEFKIINN